MDGFECINANRIDASINSDIASQPVDRFNRIFLVEIDDFGALFTRHIESGLDSIHSEDPPGSEQLCTSDSELTDRATTEDRDSVSMFDVFHEDLPESSVFPARHTSTTPTRTRLSEHQVS